MTVTFKHVSTLGKFESKQRAKEKTEQKHMAVWFASVILLQVDMHAMLFCVFDLDKDFPETSRLERILVSQASRELICTRQLHSHLRQKKHEQQQYAIQQLCPLFYGKQQWTERNRVPSVHDWTYHWELAGSSTPCLHSALPRAMVFFALNPAQEKCSHGLLKMLQPEDMPFTSAL